MKSDNATAIVSVDPLYQLSDNKGLPMSVRLLVTFLLFTLPVRGFCDGHPQNDKIEPESLMTLEVQLDGIALSKTTFPLRYAQSGTIVEEPQKTISFSFKPKHAVLWMRELGSTVTPTTTQPNQLIECSIRMYSMDKANHLGAGSSRLTIRGSFYSEDKILTNAIHIAHPKKRDRSEIATGLVILTYPVK
jgi:hypothetical protein